MTFLEFYKYSWFSNMAYVLWNETNTNSPEAMRDAANGARRVPGNPDSSGLTLGDFIFDENQQGWTIPSFYQNDDFGFAANLFLNENTNEKVLAIRGTEADPLISVETYLDLIKADISEIGDIGLALNQGVSLFNYIQRLQAEEGKTDVLQLTLHITRDQSPPAGTPFISKQIPQGQGTTVTEYFWFEAGNNGTGLGLLNEGDQVTVTGHSLGGHLAALALRLSPGLFDQAVTFNAAGFDPITSSGLTDKFVDLFSNYLTTPPADTFTELSPRLYTLESEDSAPGDDTSVVASLFTGTPASTEAIIRTENNSHSMDQFMDALGTLSLMESLNPQLSQAQIFNLFDAVSHISGETEERFLRSLSNLFLNNDTSLEAVEAGLVSHGDFARRSAIHIRILEIQQIIGDNPGLTITPLNALASELKVKALGLSLDDPADALAYRYALVNLNPFVITGNNAVYAEHNNDGELDLYNPATDEGTLTERYLEDRALFLSYLIQANITDSRSLNDSNESYLFMDAELDIQLRKFRLGGGIPIEIKFGRDEEGEPEVIRGGINGDHLFGQRGNDILVGGKGSDYLEGGKGDDILYSNSNLDTLADDAAVDVLAGGEGFDTYYVGLNDIIRDSDGRGEIRINGEVIPLSKITLVSGTTDLYTNNDPDNPVRFKQLANGNLQLIGSFVTVEGFSNSDFGIHLDPDTPTPDLNYIEGTAFDDRAGSTDPDAIHGGIGGTEGADEIHGLGGDDDIDGFEGDDVIIGGAGDDLLIGGFGHDVIDGGEDRDVILSGIGKDVLLGGASDDFLSGFDDDDFLEGGDGNDFLAGGIGSDTLLGCEGFNRWGKAA